MNRPCASEQAARWLAENGGTCREAGEQFGITREAVRSWWRLLFGSTPLPLATRVALLRERVLALVSEGKRAAEIAQSCSVPPRTVYKIMSKAGIKSPKDETRAAAIAAAVEAVRAGAVVVDAAADHGVSWQTLRRALEKAGVRSTGTSKGRSQGRSARVLARVAAGERMKDACIVERVSPSAVSIARSRARRNQGATE